jgi:hypothetical protein
MESMRIGRFQIQKVNEANLGQFNLLRELGGRHGGLQILARGWILTTTSHSKNCPRGQFLVLSLVAWILVKSNSET